MLISIPIEGETYRESQLPLKLDWLVIRGVDTKNFSIQTAQSVNITIIL